VAARSPNFLLIEDETILRELLRNHLRDAYPGCQISEAATFAEARAQATGAFDLAIVDLELPDGNCLDWVQDWAASKNCPRIVILSSHDQDFILYRALRSAIPGFVHKNDPTEVLHVAIRTVLAGGIFFSPTVQRMRMRMQSGADFFNKILSEKEQEVLRYLGLGMADEEVAAALGLRASSIALHRKHIMRKLDLHSQVDLMRYAIEKGFAQI
jgi:DNA-binding NarL/FixJ family response regulator